MKVIFDNPHSDKLVLTAEDFSRHGVAHQAVTFDASNNKTADVTEEGFELLKRLGIKVKEAPVEEASDEEEKPYTEWSKKELQDEIDARNEGRDEADVLKRTGTVAELAGVLASDDEAAED